jgi:hypothetical protein
MDKLSKYIVKTAQVLFDSDKIWKELQVDVISSKRWNKFIL